jgi:di/tricarboxylate transporter
MTMQIALLFMLLAGMVYLFLTEKIPVDLTAFLGLVILVLGGFLPAENAFEGFASSAVITMLSIFIISAALLQTGLADRIGEHLHKVLGSREVVLIAGLMVIAGVLSAFMNNIAATAVLMPAVAAVARRAQLAPSRLFMPLAFGAVLGGTLTEVGTPPNILAAAMLKERGLEPFTLFDFTPVGAVLLALGVVFMLTFGRKLLPTRLHEGGRSEAADPTVVYHLQEKLFGIRIPPGSNLDGCTLGELQLGSALGMQVAAIVRSRGRKELAPSADAVLHGGDRLLIKGRRSDLDELLQVQGVEVHETTVDELSPIVKGVGGVRLRLPAGSPLVGKTLRELGFRRRYEVVVIGVQRHQELLREELASLELQAGDEIIALGTREQLAALREYPEMEVGEVGLTAVRELEDELFVIVLPDGSPLTGQTVRESRIGELVGLTVAGIIRDGQTQLAISPDDPLVAGDQLLVAGDPSRLLHLLQLREAQIETEVPESSIESDTVGVVEGAIAPRSAAAGKTLAELDFRDRFGLQVLAIWREGEAIERGLAHLPLRFGDAFLLQGSWEKIRKLAKDPDYVILAQTEQGQRRPGKAPFALGGLLLMIAMVVLNFQPIHIAAFTAATLVVLSGALTMEEAYRAIEWRAIFLVAAVLPVGIAMEETQAATFLSSSVTELAGPLGNYAVLTALVVLASLLSQGLDGAPAVVLLTPVVLKAAEALEISPYPLMMGVALAASAAFMTPFSHKANLLVMGAGGYRSMDYVKVGTPLTVAVLAVIILLVPVFFPF